MSSGSVESDFVPVKSAERVLRLIELLTEHRNGLSFTQLHDLTGWPRSSLYGLLRTMAERHHLDHDPYRQVYRIGVRVWEAGQTFNWGVEIANCLNKGGNCLCVFTVNKGRNKGPAL